MAAFPGETGLFDGDERRRAARVAALDDQRMLLLALRGDVAEVLHRLIPAALHWQAESARRYGTAREELCAEVRQVLWAVDDAVSRVSATLAAIDQVG
jgi:hypothetical protein